MKEYFCTVKLEISGFNYEAKNETDYKNMVKAQFFEDYGIELVDSDIFVEKMED